MGFFDGFPFTNTHTLNLDWILGEMKKIPAKVDEAVRIGVAPVASALDLHVEDFANPHNVTLAQVGGAPAGYGLGEQDSGYISDCNTTTRIGWYSMTGSTLNMPSDSFYIGALRVERRGQYITQTAIAYTNEAKRNSDNGGATWSEWEYVNPPMVEGVEYRTTERWNGKAVYTKLVDFGALPNAENKMVNIGINASQIFRVDFKVYDGTEMCSDIGNSTYAGAVTIYENSLSVYTQKNLSAFNGMATIWYTKD